MQRMKRVYISGQMSGLPREEYIARFAKAEELLRQEGFDVMNPTRLLPCRWSWLYRLMGYRLTLMYDLWRLSKCDLIYKMPGWKESHGANIESCWAFHTGIFNVPLKLRERLDKKMAKYICRQWERSDTVAVDLAALQQRAQERNFEKWEQQEHERLKAGSKVVIVKPASPPPTPPQKPKTEQHES